MPDDPDIIRLAYAAHRRAGYEAGYTRAIADVLAAGVFLAEKTLRDSPADARAVLYRFVATLEAEARRLADKSGDVSDGLGI